jgi:hypothetical protein
MEQGDDMSDKYKDRNAFRVEGSNVIRLVLPHAGRRDFCWHDDYIPPSLWRRVLNLLRWGWK